MLRNITLRAEDTSINSARAYARQEHTTLSALFREWLRQYAKRKIEAEGKERVRKFDALMERLSYVEPGRKFTREEMNER